jgi:hypothetical protein
MTTQKPTLGKLTRIERYALRWLQRRCPHPSNEVRADLAEADYRPLMVTWCPICGAIALNRQEPDGSVQWREMRRPQPTWLP